MHRQKSKTESSSIIKERLASIDAHYDFIKHRQKELEQVQMQLADINDIFKNMHYLTVQQTTAVDSIVANMQNNSELTKKGTDEIEKADKNSKRRCVIL